MFYMLQDTENSSLGPSLHSQCSENEPGGPISVQELKAAKTHLLKWSQFLIDKDSLGKKLVAEKVVDGIFRAHGQLEDVRCLLEELRKPIILQKITLL